MPQPRATLWIMGITIAAWIVASWFGLGAWLAGVAGFIPLRLTGSLAIDSPVPAWLTPLSATLLHGGIIHLGFNMLMFGYCGRFAEYALGVRGMLVLYVAGAYVAAAGQFLWSPQSNVPMVGASGAVSAIVGAYALLFGQREGATLRTQIVKLAAGWIFLQLLIGLASFGEGVSIAIAAHIGGFIAGLLLARPLLLWRYRTA